MLTSLLVSLQCVELCQYLGFFALSTADAIRMASSVWSVSGLKSFFNSISIKMSDALFKGDDVGLIGRHPNYHLSLFISFQSYINPSSTVFHNQNSSFLS